MSVVIETTVGDLTVDLFTEERPIACLNFIKLCKLKYYNYNLFHTIEQGFIAQTGDPTGAGDGGTSIWGVVEGVHKRFFEAEYLPKIYHSSAGLLSLVCAGKGLVGSQFFFTLGENLSSLDGIHCVIGEVVEGHETLRKLNEAIVDEKFRPYQDIRITHTVILDDPFPDPRGFQVPSRSPSPSAERLQNGRIAADEDIDDTDGKSLEEVQEMLAEREAKARATILEIVGDLPDADVAPPENVLFVCKLNPVTTDDDLEIIFSRFGKVKCCEVIRDKQSGDSLQYAFVEFEDQSACEAAYFKMDNVLIDDRRIHVDFSQSVARVKWRGKGRGVEGQAGRLDFNNLRSKPENHRRDGGDRRANGKNQDERQRMTSEERRTAREKRHRAQEQRDKIREKSRSRERCNDYRKNDARRDFQGQRKYNRSPDDYRRTQDIKNGRNYQAERSRGDRDNRRAARSRSWSNDSKYRNRPRNEDKPEDQRRFRGNDSSRNRSKERDNRIHNRYGSHEHKRRDEHDDKSGGSRNLSVNIKRRKDESLTRERDKRNKQQLERSKKSKRRHKSESSTSTSESDSESSSDESSSTSSSSSSSSEDDKRHKKKSSKTKKKRKNIKNKKKSKKHRK